MQSRDFCFWLQGFFELGDDTGIITVEQAATMRRHLDLAFVHDISLRERPAPPVPEPVVPPSPARDTPPDPGPAPILPPEPPRC